MPFVYRFSVNSFSQQLNEQGQPHCDESTAHFEHSFTICSWSPQSLHSQICPFFISSQLGMTNLPFLLLR